LPWLLVGGGRLVTLLPLVTAGRDGSALGRLVTGRRLVAGGGLVARRRNIAWLRWLGAGLLWLWCFIWGTHGITVDRRLKVA
jgi:hypothetical protein